MGRQYVALTQFPDPHGSRVVAGSAGTLLSLCLALACGLGAVQADEGGEAPTMGRVQALARQGEWEKADALLVTLAARAQARGDVAAELEALHNRLTCRGRLHDFRGLRDVSRRILALHVETGQEAEAAKTALDLGYLECELGSLADAELLLVGAASFFAGQEEPLLRAHAALRLADVHARQRRYALALDHAEAAEASFRAQDAHADVASALTILGAIFLDLGNPARARKAFEEAQSLHTDDQPLEHADVTANIGLAQRVEGDLDGAIETLEEARTLYLGLGDHRAASRVAIQIAASLARAGQPEDARKHLQSALLEVAEDDAIGHAYALRYLGDVLLRLKRPTEATPHYESALVTADANADRHLASACHRGLAEVHLAANDAKGAVAHARKALASVGELVAGLAPVSGSLGRGEREDVFRTALRVGFASGDPEAAFELLERSRAGALVQGLGGRGGVGTSNLPPALQRDEADASEALLAAQAHLAMAWAGGSRPAIRAAKVAHRKALEAYEAVVDRIQRSQVPGAGAAFARTASLETARAALKPREALVLYGLSEDRAYALVVTEGKVRVVDLASRRDIEKARTALDVPHQDEEAIRKHVRALRTVLVAPLKLPSDIERVLVSPDGGLAYLPYVLLWPKRDVILVPSATVFVDLRRRTSDPGTRVLALGDPRYVLEYEGRAHSVYAEGALLPPLQASREEVFAVTDEKDTRLLDKRATEDALLAALPKQTRWRAVHLACHGLVNDAQPSLSALALTPSDASDGFLTVLEVFGRDVPADLVVLSACETGLGRAVAGDGILGLTQAFLYAGSTGVVASLWKVDDDATRELMEAFYAGWRTPGENPMPAARALREAQALVRKKRPHPKYWAGWVLWGHPD